MKRSRLFLPPLVFLLMPLVILACSDRDETTAPVDNGGNGGHVTEVRLSNFAFSAPTITISRGDTVRWLNTTSTFHTVTPDGHQVFVERQTNAQGQSFATRFDTPGRYQYYCAPHRALGMIGEIVVN